MQGKVIIMRKSDNIDTCRRAVLLLVLSTSVFKNTSAGAWLPLSPLFLSFSCTRNKVKSTQFMKRYGGTYRTLKEALEAFRSGAPQ